jgi:hypothetical protein
MVEFITLGCIIHVSVHTRECSVPLFSLLCSTVSSPNLYKNILNVHVPDTAGDSLSEVKVNVFCVSTFFVIEDG